MCYSIVINRKKNDVLSILSTYETIEICKINPGWANNIYDITFITKKDFKYSESPEIEIVFPYKTWLKSVEIKEPDGKIIQDQIRELKKFRNQVIKSKEQDSSLYNGFNMDNIYEMIENKTDNKFDDIILFIENNIKNTTPFIKIKNNDITIDKETESLLIIPSPPKAPHYFNKINVLFKNYDGIIEKNVTFTIRIIIRIASAKWHWNTYGEAEAYFFEFPSPDSNRNYLTFERDKKSNKIIKNKLNYEEDEIVNTLYYIFKFYGSKNITFTQGIEKISHAYWPKGKIINYSTGKKFKKEASIIFFDFISNPRKGWIIKWKNNFNILITKGIIGFLALLAAVVTIITTIKNFL